MKITVEFDIEIDGETVSEERAKEIFAEYFRPLEAIFLSENIEDPPTDEYAIIIEGWEII